MNPKTTFDAENAEKTERTQSFPGNLSLTQWVNTDFPSATSAALRTLRCKRFQLSFPG